MELNVIKLVRKSDSNVFIFEEGTMSYLPEAQYSADGVYNWESIPNPLPHMSEANPKIKLEGHKYIRFRLNPTEEWSAPLKIVGEDGLTPEFIVLDKYLTVSYEGVLPKILFDLR